MVRPGITTDNRGRFLFIISLFLFMSSYVFAQQPRITSVTMTPPNPGYGENFHVDVELCIGEYVTGPQILLAVSSHADRYFPSTSGQVYLVSSQGVNVPWVGPPSSDGGEYGWTLPNGPEWADVKDCTDCDGAQGWTVIESYDLTMPQADAFPGCDISDLYLHIATHTDPMNKTYWAENPDDCNHYSDAFTIPVPDKEMSMQKNVEGVASLENDLVFFSIDYKYGNGQMTITDPMPAGGNLRFVKAGPVGLLSSTPAVGATSGTTTWVLPDRTGQTGYSVGTVWFLAEVDHDLTNGTVINNTATGSMSGISNVTASTSLTAGEAAMTIDKYQSADEVTTGDTVTYTLEYEINGMALKSVNNFDELSAGAVYSGGTAPPGWQFEPFNGNTGTWTVVDPCGTGDTYIRARPDGPSEYPGMLVNTGVPSNDQFCEGMIVSDVMIEPSGYAGSDAQVIIRHNGESGATSHSISLVISIDNAPGFVAFQTVTGGSAAWPSTLLTNTPGIIGDIWFKVRILAEINGNNVDYSAKVWKKGDPEPAAYTLTWTHTNGATGVWDCNGTYNDWRPGVNEQGGDTADEVYDSYDNFMVYEARASSDAFVADDIPAGITYAGCDGCNSTNPVRWNLGTISNEGGSLTWWGVADCTQDPNPILNTALIDGADTEPVYSNETSLDVLCATDTPTNTPTETDTPTDTATSTDTPTNTSTYTFTATNTDTLTFTPTFTFTDTPTFTFTDTPTDTFTDTPTFTFTDTFTDTATFTFTDTPTDTNTPTDTFTDTPTFTFTDTFTDTVTHTFTDTPTETFTVTYTVTDTPTGPPPDTWTPTDTFTDTATATDTATFSPTNTSTDTFTATDTPTDTATNTATNSPTDTFTVTDTYTPTPTVTDTVPGPTATFTDTPTPTYTFTDTNTPTYTYTSTYTFTPTDTWTETPLAPTNTFTNTNTFTDTPTNTYTHTSTYTWTSTYTPTATFTFTDTPTDTYTFTSTDTSTDTFTPTETFTYTYTPTPTNTLPPFPYVLRINVYNEAGELVRTIAETRATRLMSNVELQANGAGTDTASNESPLYITMRDLETPETLGNGDTVFVWGVSNNADQQIPNGPYYIKFEMLDEYGHSNVMIKDINVINVSEYVEINIYNAGGEKVRTIREEKSSDTNAVSLKIDDMIVIESDVSNIKLPYTEDQNEFLRWDGLNEYGQAVSSGTYEIQVIVKNNKGDILEASKTVIILREGKAYLEEVMIIPNPVKANSISNMAIAWKCSVEGKAMVTIYNMAGEKVRNLFAPIQTGYVLWDMKTSTGQPVSQGYYVVIVETSSSDGYVDRKVTKLAIN